MVNETEILNEAERSLALQIRAAQPLINLISFEEERVIERLKLVRQAVIDLLSSKAASMGVSQKDIETWYTNGFPLVVWSCTEGFVNKTNLKFTINTEERDPVSALIQAIKAVPQGPLFVFKDLHPYIDRALTGQYRPEVVRLLRDLAQASRREFRGENQIRCTSILLSPVQVIPTELEKEVSLVIYPVPNRKEMAQALDTYIEISGANKDLSVDAKNNLVTNSLGLTQMEAEDAWRRSVANSGGELDASMVEAMTSVKKAIIEKSGLLEYIPSSSSMDSEVGGLNDLKGWVRVRRLAMQASDKIDVKIGNNNYELNMEKLPPLKGILLVGPPGCGKSLSARAVANELQMPLIRLDVGRIYEALLGKAEENLRRALATVDELAPCVLWVDEIEKAFPKNSGIGDSGVSSRILGTFLFWMQEKKSLVFVVGTANNYEVIPPELMRKGRLDEIFFVGLPSPEDRRKIFEIHLMKYGIVPNLLPLDEFVKNSDKFTGAEVEQAVVNAIRELQANQPGDLVETLLSQIKLIRPLSSRKEDRDKWIAWEKQAAEVAAIASEKHNSMDPGSSLTFKRVRVN